MSYRFEAGEEVERGVKRMAREQIDEAIAEIDNRTLGHHETVHQVRKRCKKVRALVRLVRPALGPQYGAVNAHFRDLARPLSDIRDAHALVETFDELDDEIEADLPAAFAPVREALVARRDRQAAGMDVGGLLAGARESLLAGRAAVDDWRVEGEGFAAVAGGLGKVYRRGRRAMADAGEDPTAAKHHEWRKRAKYLWYHLRILVALWPGVIGALREEADRLATALGDDHDVHVMHATVEMDPTLASADGMRSYLDLLAGRSAGLREEAARLGQRLYAEKPRRFVARLARYEAADGVLG